MRRPQLWEKFTGTTFEPRNHRYTSLVNAVALHVDELVEQLRTQQQQLVLSTERKEAVPQPPRQDDAHLLVE